MSSQQNWRRAIRLAALGVLVLGLAGCVLSNGSNARATDNLQSLTDTVQTFIGDFLRQVLQYAVL